MLANYIAIKDALVLVLENRIGEKQLVAYIIPRDGYTFTISLIEEYLSVRLPPYMIPSSYVILEKFPLTQNGKVDRRALYNNEQPELMAPEYYTAPRNYIEENLALIWAECFRIERVGIHDNFFDLGGHSILAMQLLGRMRQAFQIELSLVGFLANPTIAGVAVAITQARADQIERADLIKILEEVEGLQN
jgi:hypothetical protein